MGHPAEEKSKAISGNVMRQIALKLRKFSTELTYAAVFLLAPSTPSAID